jgi:hypothetical protein
MSLSLLLVADFENERWHNVRTDKTTSSMLFYCRRLSTRTQKIETLKVYMQTLLNLQVFLHQHT